ncbi:histone deacetylase family protein [Sediminicoccus sp. KRV36]|uniref:histone deacetylase family protein n=1 Tax=Sediminicoccus sp. KRV36 TaxID=3133721 RepID=UPI00200BCB55|nr:histone deacetylase family protein [Sediminicoccus rosea]UPY34896.1 histone deacetylase family protein [Sediminicoccus rosea]
MKAFHHPDEALHAPEFFLTRGRVRANYEVPARAVSLREGLSGLGITPELTPPAPQAALLRLHTPEYLHFLEHAATEWAALPEAGPEIVANIHPTPEMLAQSSRAPGHVISRAGAYTADTACPIGPGTWTAAIGAAGCALAAADVAAAGGRAYALCRPPGHHAYAGRAGGHCYINNSALAAQRLRDAGAARVAVLDIDSHHGNGTQGIFWDRADVLTISLHADPSRYYPWYVGFAEETGTANLNLPQPFGTGDAAWLAALDDAIAAIRAFRPEALVVPLGFDASEFEPLAALKVTADGFARAGAAIGALRLPTAICQEGGYNVEILGSLLQRFLTGFGDAA